MTSFTLHSESEFIRLELVPVPFRVNAPEFFAFVRDYFKAKIMFLSIEDEAGRLAVLPLAEYVTAQGHVVGTLPRMLGLASPVRDLPIDFGEVARFLKREFPKHDVIYLNLVDWRDCDRFAPGFIKVAAADLILDVTDDDADLLRRFDKKTRNQVRQSLKQDFAARFNETAPGELYDLYLENMRRHGTRPKLPAYFEALRRHLGDKLVVLEARLGGDLCGVNVFYVNGDYLLLMFNLSRERYWPQRVNNFLYHSMLEYGFAHGVRHFDYGANMSADASITDFKRGFGGEAHDVWEYMSYRSFGRRCRQALLGPARRLKAALSKLMLYVKP